MTKPVVMVVVVVVVEATRKTCCRPHAPPPPRISGQLRKRHGCPPPRVQEGVIMQPRRVEQERGGEEVAEKAVRKE